MPKKHSSLFKNVDWSLFGLIIGLTIFGVLMVYNASVPEALRDFQDKYFYLKYQVFWAFLGLIFLMIALVLPLNFWKKISWPLFILNIFLLILVLIPGIGMQIKGARRWLDLGFSTLQPSELIKFTFCLYLAVWLEKPRRLIHFLCLLGFVILLIMLEPDLGTTVVVATMAFLIYFLSGVSIFKILPLGLLGLLIGLIIIFSSPYRRQRVMTFLNPSQDPLGSSYHVRQILLALGSGGFTGVGLGQSRQKYEYLPEATTDSIFAIIAEEIGFLGSSILIAIMLFIILKALNISYYSTDNFCSLLAGGISFWWGIQIIVNLGAMVAIFPLTGLPLPFISYGGSSLISVLTGAGLLLNISKYTTINKYKKKK